MLLRNVTMSPEKDFFPVFLWQWQSQLVAVTSSTTTPLEVLLSNPSSCRANQCIAGNSDAPYFDVPPLFSQCNSEHNLSSGNSRSTGERQTAILILFCLSLTCPFSKKQQQSHNYMDITCRIFSTLLVTEVTAHKSLRHVPKIPSLRKSQEQSGVQTVLQQQSALRLCLFCMAQHAQT